jgi:hypothetical protein
MVDSRNGPYVIKAFVATCEFESEYARSIADYLFTRQERRKSVTARYVGLLMVIGVEVRSFDC